MSTDQKTDALQNELRQAVLENNAPRVEGLLEGQTLDEDFRFELIGGLVAAGDHAALVKRLTEEVAESITPTALVTYLASAARQGHSETAAYFFEKSQTAGIPQLECIERTAKNTPAEKIGDVAHKIADVSENPARMLSDFMLSAAMAKEFTVLAALADAGATMGPHGGIMMLMAMKAREESLSGEDQKPAYLTLMGKLIDSGCDDANTFDISLPLIAYKLPSGEQ